MAYQNFVQVIEERGAKHPSHPCLRFHRDGEWKEISYGQVLARARAIAGGLAALGVEPGDRVAILSENQPEWAIADLGSIAAGAVVVAVYAGLPASEAAYIINHSDSRVLFAETPMQAAKILSVRQMVPRLERIVVLNNRALDDGCLIPLSDLEALGTPERIAARLATSAARSRDEPITLLYTSGTTGTPKGVVLTHANILDTTESTTEALGDWATLDTTMRVLPLAHALERIAGHFMPFYKGWTMVQVRGLDTIAEDFRTIRPNFVALVPRVFEKMYAAIQSKAEHSSMLTRAIFRWALAAGTERSLALEQGREVAGGLALRYAIADRLVFRKVREAMGGEIKIVGSGGAPLSPEIARFFHAAGVLICEAWGATETTGPSTFNMPTAYRFGSVGRAMPGVEVKVADDGELLVRGVNVFKEYFKDRQATEEAFDPDGFYKTGDIGRIDEDGYVYITDRKKELIITAAGKNIAPQKLENMLRERPFVSNCMVYCDRRPYVVALVTLDRATLKAGYPELGEAEADDPRIHAVVEREVRGVNERLARFEQIKAFRVIPREFSPESGELTLTLKLKRRVIEANYKDVLDGLYNRTGP